MHLTNLRHDLTIEVVAGAAISTVYAFVMAFPLSESALGLIVYVFVGAFGALAVCALLSKRWLPDASLHDQSTPAAARERSTRRG